MLLLVPHLWGQAPQEMPLSSENAYNPIPSPDGKLIAYVRTGWGRPGGSGGFGRSNLVSQALIMDARGKQVSTFPTADSFLAGWSEDSRKLVLYRDWRYRVVTLEGKTVLRGQLRNADEAPSTERVFYLSGLNAIGWSHTGKASETIIETKDHVIAKHAGWLGQNVVPSPNGRYLAVFGEEKRTNLFVYDMDSKGWSDLGPITVHLDPDWDYIKPSWNPWFADSSHLAYFSGSTLVISEPDGKSRKAIPIQSEAGLATPSPDGNSVAYVTFDPRPMDSRPDLPFYGGTRIWILRLSAPEKPFAITKKDAATTFDLRWLNNQELVFDRIQYLAFMKQTRLWKVFARQKDRDNEH